MPYESSKAAFFITNLFSNYICSMHNESNYPANELTLVTVPINFEYEGKPYSALIVPLSGAGSAAHFFVMVNNYCMGQLFYAEHSGWQFYGNNFHGMGQYFGEYLMAWYQ